MAKLRIPRFVEIVAPGCTLDSIYVGSFQTLALQMSYTFCYVNVISHVEAPITNDDRRDFC